LLKSLLKRLSREEAPRAPDGTVIWAVGDIHGRSDLLEPLLDAIGADLDACGAERRMAIFLGDYVDRGPASSGVLDLLSAFAERDSVEARFVTGNHEDRMLVFLTQPETGGAWGEFGGRETLWSYGVRPPSSREPADWAEASQAFGAALPAHHRALLGRMEPAVEAGDYFFCHAGARPGVPLSQQSPDDLMWIRAEFLEGRSRFERVVVHGHTPEAEVHADARRIGIDTGAYATGVLTGLRLEGTERRLLQTRMRGRDISLIERPLPGI
jgi:serine/threonine protein phosphatase 1